MPGWQAGICFILPNFADWDTLNQCAASPCGAAGPLFRAVKDGADFVAVLRLRFRDCLVICDLFHELSGYGFEVPPDLDDYTFLRWGDPEHGEWTYDATAVRNGFVLRFRAQTGDGPVDIAFTPTGSVARAMIGERSVEPQEAMGWLLGWAHAVD